MPKAIPCPHGQSAIRRCTICNKVRLAQYAKKWRTANPEKAKANKRGWDHGHRPRVNSLQRYHRAWNPDRARDYDLKRYYGLGPGEYDQLLIKQNGRCAICGRLPDIGKRLCVDHDHRTNAIRGLLCQLCNRGLGMLGDSPTTLQAAMRYLGA